jgi:membrane dipeptidase
MTPPFPIPRRSFFRHGLKAAGAALFAPAFNLRLKAADSKQLWRTGHEGIDRARETALALLQPSPAQLQRAWELHSASLVFDAYGFAPRAALDAAGFQAAVEAGASDDELVDLREEMSMTRWATDPREREEFLTAFRAAGVTCIFQNAGEEGNDPMRLIRRLARFTYATDLMRPEVFKAVNADEVETAKKDGRLCLCLTTNGVPLPPEAKSVRDEVRQIRIFRQLGVRMMHVTYNRRNPLGDGAGEPNDGGLSDFGHAAIAELNRAGVIADVAHSGWRTSLDAAKASAKPMVASHTSCAGLYRHFRGKPDDVIKAICDTGGLVGICCIPRFLGAKGDMLAFLDHLDYLVKKFGSEHAAIGTDVSHVSRFDVEERRKIAKRPDGSMPLNAAGPRWEHLWPQDNFKTTAEAERSIAWTNWPLFTLGLVMRGHRDEDIQKILGGNVLRVIRANAER